MKILKLPLAGLLFCTVPFWMGCGTSDKSEAPVSLTWEMGASDIAPGYYENSFVLKNISDAPLPKDWTIYYSQLPRNVKQAGNPAVKVESVKLHFAGTRRFHAYHFPVFLQAGPELACARGYLLGSCDRR